MSYCKIFSAKKTQFSQSTKNPSPYSDEGSYKNFGGDLLFHDAVPSALTGLTSLFGMGRGFQVFQI